MTRSLVINTASHAVPIRREFRMAELTDRFGTMVFSEEVMKDYLPKDIWKRLAATLEGGEPLDLDVANAVAHAMKVWAISKGATHYAHWFQPLSGITSEKHDSFLEPNHDGTAITKFTGKNLIQGEPDASSFPNGGLRATFEARGYTAWDPTSPAFIKDDVLCIPTAFCSYTGEALDKKTPLLRSMTALSRESKRVLALFGKTPKKVVPSVGDEQEYFLIKKDAYRKRKDLVITGRTLFGAAPCKGQELEEHYFGAIRPTVSAYMKDLDDELWALGIPAKTKHNEVAPCQHELAPVYGEVNEAIDQNLVMMEKMKLIASRHDLVCLLHEKPFEGINGSGKHNNWSLGTESENLLDPGDTPLDNLQFIVFLTAVIEAVDNYQELLRASVASAGNDHRLGANEAPPAIMSIFLGDQLTEVVEKIIDGKASVHATRGVLDLGADTLPKLMQDNTDRNRTSPFAFTGNKFEFRMLGSSASVADPNIVLNTIVAESFTQAAEKLENSNNFIKDCKAYTEKLLKAHYRVIFNYNGYGPEWEPEAERRGLLNNKNTADAVPEFFKNENIEVFVRQGVYTKSEAIARANIQLENYIKTIRIEALTMIDMARGQIYPAVSAYIRELCESLSSKKALFDSLPCTAEISLIKTLAKANEKMLDGVNKLEADLADMPEGEKEGSQRMAHVVVPDMEAIRVYADKMEKLCAKDRWPFPTYTDILFSVK